MNLKILVISTFVLLTNAENYSKSIIKKPSQPPKKVQKHSISHATLIHNQPARQHPEPFHHNMIILVNEHQNQQQHYIAPHQQPSNHYLPSSASHYDAQKHPRITVYKQETPYVTPLPIIHPQPVQIQHEAVHISHQPIHLQPVQIQHHQPSVQIEHNPPPAPVHQHETVQIGHQPIQVQHYQQVHHQPAQIHHKSVEIQHQPIHHETVQIQHQPINHETVQIQHQPINHETVQIQHQPIHHETVQIQHQPVQNEIVHHEKVKQVEHHDHHQEDHHCEPAYYTFEYGVHDSHSGDIKSQKETRNGNHVTGYYQLKEADGRTRTVEYSADKHGFVAMVKHDGKQIHTEHQKQHVVIQQVSTEGHSSGEHGSAVQYVQQGEHQHSGGSHQHGGETATSYIYNSLPISHSKHGHDAPRPFSTKILHIIPKHHYTGHH